MDITIQVAQPEQAAALREIAQQAKGYWGYSADLLAQWREALLMITPDYIEANRVWVATVEAQGPIGFAAVEPYAPEPVLEHLWVAPAYVRRGVGRRLFLHVAREVPVFIFTSDPHADGFYEKMGARPVGETYSDYQHRPITQFRYTAEGLL